MKKIIFSFLVLGFTFATHAKDIQEENINTETLIEEDAGECFYLVQVFDRNGNMVDWADGVVETTDATSCLGLALMAADRLAAKWPDYSLTIVSRY
ncbi:hypothetical protein E0W68_02970 [Flavobacterium salilacus subsp. salilacus]|uniref:hypothetical protein n=1 Tax=Flavobacterium TaxID=237 RepID=UPI001074A380|nr:MULTISPECIES: hypothetical protein [Flavobacterium]KAF2520201.1 hypothetical protein E0W68_02970 [Flavobacterium salilacus subsp. salilacus]MBE1613882.1 hypothetical protein [Flavobacterium sp. SaA2.13]